MVTNNNDAAPDTDARLVERLKARDKTALEELVRQHGAKIYGVALQIMQNETEAEEVVQDALITIWNKIDTFEGRSAFPTWLHRVTANAALMKRRKNKRFEYQVPLDRTDPERDLPVIQLADRGDAPDTTALHSELGARVQAAIEGLPEPYRTTVLLADVDGLTMEEIAEAMEASVGAVKSRLHRARLALRKHLEPYLKEQS